MSECNEVQIFTSMNIFLYADLFVKFVFCLSLWRTMNPPRLTVTERRWSWMEKRYRSIFWIRQGKRITLLSEITTSAAEKVFFWCSPSQSLNPSALLQSSGVMLFSRSSLPAVLVFAQTLQYHSRSQSQFSERSK